MANLVEQLRNAAASGQREIDTYERTSARTSVLMARLLNEAAHTIEVQCREIEANIEVILEQRKGIRAQGIETRRAEKEGD